MTWTIPEYLFMVNFSWKAVSQANRDLKHSANASECKQLLNVESAESKLS